MKRAGAVSGVTFTLALLVESLLGETGLAADRALGCGAGLVMVGATKEEVLRKCGDPTSRERISQRTKRGARPRSNTGKARKRSPAETWTYDLGANQLVRYLTFKDGRLLRIELGGYGN